MEKLERGLKSRALLVSLLLAALLAWALSTDGIVSEDIMPLGDSEAYVLRGMTLYGYLHTAQWEHFWDTFTLPRQSLAPLHYWLFFLLPQRWASMTSYGVIQAAATYGLLAFAAWKLCRALDRPQWSPALFLFCAAQNISLDYSYFYYADVPFMALGTLVLAWQVEAWRANGWRSACLAGFGAGLMFWIKAPNAIIFTATFVLAELIGVAILWRGSSGEGKALTSKKALRHAVAIAAGFFPVALAALACGGFQSIIELIDANEVSGFFSTTIEASGLRRLLYFPLCLTFFYHATMLLLIFTAVGFLSWRVGRPAENASAPFPAARLLPLIGAYFILGEFFSFGMANKEMRSLLILLPVLWLAIFWLLEKGRVRFGLVFIAAAIYALGGMSQVFFNGFETMDVSSQGYQLKNDWLARLPQPHPVSLAEIGLTRNLLQLIGQALPGGGKIAVGTEQLYVTSESLIWCEEHDLALRGQGSPFEFENFLTADGRYSRRSLLHARGIFVMLQSTFQYSQDNYRAAAKLVTFCSRNWLKAGFAQMVPIGNSEGKVAGVIIVLKEPLTDARIDELIAGTGTPELPPDVNFGASVPRRLSWAECTDILKRWGQKRLGHN